MDKVISTIVLCLCIIGCASVGFSAGMKVERREYTKGLGYCSSGNKEKCLEVVISYHNDRYGVKSYLLDAYYRKTGKRLSF